MLLRQVSQRSLPFGNHAVLHCAVAVQGLVLVSARFGGAVSLVWGGVAVEPATSLLVGAIMLGSAPAGINRLLGSLPAVTLGRPSYGIYLWHFPITMCLRDRLDFLPAFLVTVSVSTVLAAFSYITVEAVVKRSTVRKAMLPEDRDGSLHTTDAHSIAASRSSTEAVAKVAKLSATP